MPLHLNSARSTPAPLEPAEARMREALGLGDRPPIQATQERADQARRRHRFVRDGEIPVVVVNSRKEQDPGASHDQRLAAAEAALEAERTARAAIERTLEEAQTSIQNLQGRLAMQSWRTARRSLSSEGATERRRYCKS